MWFELTRFEIRYHLKQPLFYICASFFFGLAFLMTSTRIGLVLAKAPSHAEINAPVLVARLLTALALPAFFVITAFVASSVLRDFELGTHMLFFSKPIKKFDYLMGRFAGSMAISALIFLIVMLGVMLGPFAPWQDPSRVGPFRLSTYVFAFVVLVIPNLLSAGAILFAVAAWSRRLIVTNLCVAFALIAQDFIEDWAAGLDNGFIAGLLEPSGLVALANTARYWTAIEYNSMFPDLAGALLVNRLAWLAAGALCLVIGYTRFSYSRAAMPLGRRRRANNAIPDPATSQNILQPIDRPAPPAVTREFSVFAAWRQWWSQTRLETALVLKSIPFLILLLMSVTFVFSFAGLAGQNRGTPIYPLTYQMLRAISNTWLFMFVIVVFYAGELVWRERASNVAQVTDAFPTPTWVFLAAKVTALGLALGVFIGSGVLSTILYQLSRGFTDLKLGLYFAGAAFLALSFVPLIVLAVFLQVVSNNKFLGYLLTLLVPMASVALKILGFEHHLYRYGTHTPLVYSDMNGYGSYAGPFLWHNLYWAFAAAILLALSLLFWVRGNETSMRTRLAIARANFKGPLRNFVAIAAVGFVATGSFIYYNTNLLNEYTPRLERVQRMVDYEEQYGKYRDSPLPRVASVRADVDIFPDERRVEIRGSYQLKNIGDEPIALLPITWAHRMDHHDFLPSRSRLTVHKIDTPAHETLVIDDRLGFHLYELLTPLLPGETMELGFHVTAENRGFSNGSPDERIVGNGTFFSNKNLFPSLGYAQANQLYSPRLRKKHGLPLIDRMAKIDDAEALNRNYLDSDWTRFETVVSTSEDQIAIGPGRLEHEWSEGGRRYFHYKTEAPVIDLGVFVSARFEVAREPWNDVEIEVYFDPAHPFNVENIITATRNSLDYFTDQFGPYPNRQLRIVEVPNYFGLTAMSLAGTIICSESWGFISPVEGADIDIVTNIIAHEVAHQWWNHQVIPADVQGATLISEALSEYSTLMVMKRASGIEGLRHTLKWELEGYLKGRSRDAIGERPLMLVENQQYIHYGKGSLILYALQDYVGEEAINRALREFLDAQAFAGPPYATSRDLLDHLRAAIPPEFDYLIEDMFETITLFDNRVDDATWSRRDDGTYLVRLEVTSRKLRADESGTETEVPIDDWIDVGVFGTAEGDTDDEVLLFLEKRQVTDQNQLFEIVVAQQPRRAGIDPYNKLIDRDLDDNVKPVREAR